MKIESAIEINNPPSEVYEFITEDENLSLWVNNFKKIERLTGKNGEIGATSIYFFNENGRAIEMTETTVNAVENKEIASVLKHEQTDLSVTYRIEADNEDSESCKISSFIEYKPNSVFFKLFLSFNRKKLVLRYQEDLEQLKNAIEHLSESEFEMDDE